MPICRCASCGSRNVTEDVQLGGISYNYAKGFVGTIVFGTGGAVAGLENKEQAVYKCSDCGLTLSRCMPENLQSVIDICVYSLEMRKELPRLGYGSWEFLCEKYKNIESGLGDQIKKREHQKLRESKLNQLEENLSIEMLSLAEEVRLFYTNDFDNVMTNWSKPSEDELLAMVQQWESRCKIIEQHIEEELGKRAKELKQSTDASIENIEKEKKNKIEKLQKELNEATIELNDSNEEFLKLGIFSFGKKKALKQHIESITTSIEQIEKELEKAPSFYANLINEEHSKYEEKSKDLQRYVKGDNPLPKDPRKTAERIEFLKKTHKMLKEWEQNPSRPPLPYLAEELGLEKAKFLVLLMLEFSSGRLKRDDLLYMIQYIMIVENISAYFGFGGEIDPINMKKTDVMRILTATRGAAYKFIEFSTDSEGTIWFEII